MFVHTPPPAPASCLRALPRSPGGVPATIALDAGCALVVFTPRGHARLRPRPSVPETVGAQLSPGDGVTFRDGHVVRVRDGHVVWRSSRTFQPGTHRGTFTTISTASARGASMAYVVSRWWGTPRLEHRLVFVTTGAGRERRIPTTAYPLGWSVRGLVTADASRRRLELQVWRADARPLSTPRVFEARAWVWDWTTNRVVVATGSDVVRTDGVSSTRIGKLAALGFGRRPRYLVVSPLGRGLVELSTPSRLVVLDAVGRSVAQTTLPAGWRLDGAISADPSGAVAFEATPVSNTSARRFRLYAALSGGKPRLLDRYGTPPSCAGHALSVRGSVVLLTGDTLARVYDLRRATSRVDLEPAVQWLRRHNRTGLARFA
jgi:hypothetical protein